MQNIGFVYFLQIEGTSYIKIGFSRTPYKRIEELRRKWAVRDMLQETRSHMVFLGAFPGTQKEEAALHRMHAYYRVAVYRSGRSEWYELPKPLIQKLKNQNQLSAETLARWSAGLPDNTESVPAVLQPTPQESCSGNVTREGFTFTT